MKFTVDAISPYLKLMRLNKPVGIYLLLWPTLMALILASQGLPDLRLLTIFTIGVVLMRSAGCVINDYADRHVDGAVKRTADRPIVSGQISPRAALLVFFVLVLLSFLLVLQLNLKTILLSFVAVILAACYPFMKRYTYFPQVVLGAAFSWAIPMAFMATLHSIPWWAWLLYLANLLWTVAYDTQYAMVDRDDDVKIGVKSTALFFGRYDLLAIVSLQLATLAVLYWMGQVLALSIVFYGTLLVVAGLFGYQFWLCRARERNGCFAAFKQNHYVGMVLTAGLLADYLISV